MMRSLKKGLAGALPRSARMCVPHAQAVGILSGPF